MSATAEKPTSDLGSMIVRDQTTSVGQEMRRLLKLSEAKSAEAIQNDLEFLSNWA